MAENKSKMMYLEGGSTAPESHIRKDGYQDPKKISGPNQGLVMAGTNFGDEERKQAFVNYDKLRQEFFRDHRPSGMAIMWDSPWIPFGLGCTVFSLGYSLSSRKQEIFAYKMLNYRVGWGIFTACGIIATLYRDKMREDKWVIEVAQERRLDIRKEDMYPYLKKKMKKSIKLPLPPLPEENTQSNEQIASDSTS